jgi:hypothetical protein
VLGLDYFYAWGFYDGFAGWGAPKSLDDADPELLSSYAVGQADGNRAWKACDPAVHARETIAKAAKLLRSTGWTRGALESRGKFALEGAIRMVMWGTTATINLDDREYKLIMSMIESYLSRRHRIPVVKAPWWNDNVCATTEEAIEVLETIARGGTRRNA